MIAVILFIPQVGVIKFSNLMMSDYVLLRIDIYVMLFMRVTRENLCFCEFCVLISDAHE